MACSSCGRGIVGECDCESNKPSGSTFNPALSTEHPVQTGDAPASEQPRRIPDDPEDSRHSEPSDYSEEYGEGQSGESKQIGRPRQEGIGVSAGRKRAAVDYPIDADAACEWQGLKNCGGGKEPVVGCLVGKQEHRHHGPDKTTSNNSSNNVHRICSSCHNLWHARNDKYPRKELAKILHSPTEATLEELAIR